MRPFDRLVETFPGTGIERFVICSGGGPGIMEAANRGPQARREHRFDISLDGAGQENPYITRRLAFRVPCALCEYWFAYYLAQGLCDLQAGFGTLDEFMEILTIIQTQRLRKKCAYVMFGSEYWDQVLKFGPWSTQRSIPRTSSCSIAQTRWMTPTPT